ALRIRVVSEAPFPSTAGICNGWHLAGCVECGDRRSSRTPGVPALPLAPEQGAGSRGNFPRHDAEPPRPPRRLGQPNAVLRSARRGYRNSVPPSIDLGREQLAYAGPRLKGLSRRPGPRARGNRAQRISHVFLRPEPAVSRCPDERVDQLERFSTRSAYT